MLFMIQFLFLNLKSDNKLFAGRPFYCYSIFNKHKQNYEEDYCNIVLLWNDDLCKCAKHHPNYQ